MIDLSIVATKIINARREKGFTQEELSVRLGISAQAISKWERGLSLPDIDLLLDLSKILDLPINYLLDSEANAVSSNVNKTIYDLCEITSEKLLESLKINPIIVLIGYYLVPAFNNNELKKIGELRKSVLQEKGVMLPTVRLMDDTTLEKNAFKIKFFDKTVCKKVVQNPSDFKIDDVVTTLKDELEKNLFEFVNRHMVKLLIENLKIYMPFVVEGVVPERISLTRLNLILKSLVKDGISIKNLHKIIETIDEEIDFIGDTPCTINKIKERLNISGN